MDGWIGETAAFARKKCSENGAVGFYGVVVLSGKTESMIASRPDVSMNHILQHAAATVADDIKQGVPHFGQYQEPQ